jgi:patatin-like phospholipase/acyl hydrolase
MNSIPAAQSETASRFQILSLDGGGIKGLFSAAVLAAIERDLNTSVIDHFDLIAGTSTGGILALGLGLGMKPREIVEFYVREGPKIFPCWLGVKWFQHWFASKYSAAPLKAALQTCFKDRTLGHSSKRLVIPSYNLGEDEVYVFRTPHHPRLKRDFKCPAWKVALATSAAPTFFPCTREIDSTRLIDGGVWANNPTLVGIVEARSTLGVPWAALSVLSIGTSDAVSHRRRRLNSGGILAWASGNAAIDVIMRGQSIGVHNQASLLLGQDKVERLNPKVAADEFSLDGFHRVDDLIGKAAHCSRVFMPTFEHKFMSHRSVPFMPLFT